MEVSHSSQIFRICGLVTATTGQQQACMKFKGKISLPPKKALHYSTTVDAHTADLGSNNNNNNSNILFVLHFTNLKCYSTE